LFINGSIKDFGYYSRIYVQDLDWDSITDTFEKTIEMMLYK
jgi:hypothetical protein